MYVRFVTARRDPNSERQQGIFQAIYDLEDAGQLRPHEMDWFVSIEEWFTKHLKTPDRFTSSSRHNARGRAITWLKMSAKEHVAWMRELAALLEHKDIHVEELRTDRPGYVVYEDEFQVATIPFAETP